MPSVAGGRSDGDGEMLMGIGSLATIGVKQPTNLSIVVLDNERYGETGMQASHTSAGVDLVIVARACGFSDSRLTTDMADAPMLRDLLHQAQGPVFIQAKIRRDDVPRVLPTRDGHEMRLRRELECPGRTPRSASKSSTNSIAVVTATKRHSPKKSGRS